MSAIEKIALNNGNNDINGVNNNNKAGAVEEAVGNNIINETGVGVVKDSVADAAAANMMMAEDGNGNAAVEVDENAAGGSSGSREFVEGWTIAQTLGEGAYGEVKLLINRQTGEAVAMKMVDLSKRADVALSVRKEVCIQRLLQDPHILRYYGKRTHGNLEYIFLEYAAGGELFDRIEPDVGMPQHEAQKYFKQILSGVNYLHQHGIAHRDLKPENLLLDEHDNIKISDFGMATLFRCKGKERMLDKRCGTLPYVAPEVLLKPYHAQAADIWSCGVILVAMLSGELPWDQPSDNCQEFVNWKDTDRWTIRTPWSKLDALALSLLRKVLATNPKQRMTLEKIIEHKWCNSTFGNNERSSGLIRSTAALEIHSPKAKRPHLEHTPSNNCINGGIGSSNFDDSMTRNYCSQPLPQMKYDFQLDDITNDGVDGGDAGDGIAAGILNNTKQLNAKKANETTARLTFCSFSQPALLDDLILCTQMNATQTSSSSSTSATSQNVFQRLVRRMTRFFVSTTWQETLKRLSLVIKDLGYTYKITDNNVVTITTIDRRKLCLVFKAYIIEMDYKILVDFRLSKGCGLEFKRRFIKIKHALGDIVQNGPITWPIAIATNSVP